MTTPQVIVLWGGVVGMLWAEGQMAGVTAVKCLLVDFTFKLVLALKMIKISI